MQNSISKAKKLLKNGELIVYPTDTLYGLGGNVFDVEALQKIYAVKRRPYACPLSIIVPKVENIEKIAFTDNNVNSLTDTFLPGALTLILKSKIDVPYVTLNSKIAIRIPKNTIALELASDFPIAATSANIHGEKEPVTVNQAKEQLGKSVSLYIDGGTLKGTPSTIIDISEEKIKIIREGAIKKEEIYGCLQ